MMLDLLIPTCATGSFASRRMKTPTHENVAVSPLARSPADRAAIDETGFGKTLAAVVPAASHVVPPTGDLAHDRFHFPTDVGHRRGAVATDWASTVSGLVAPASAAPRIASSTSVGGSEWEVSLEGDANTTFEFRSSTTLNFSPGTLVQNLTQVGVAAPAGSISGDNNEFLTTDGSGNATVRMTLSGDPKHFIRAQTTTP